MPSSSKWTELSGEALAARLEQAAAGDGLPDDESALGFFLGTRSGRWTPDAARLFDRVARNGGANLALEVVAAPGETAPPFRAGDLLVRRALGEGGLAQVSVVAAPETLTSQELMAQGLASEGLRSGAYLQVIELFPKPRVRQDGFHRLALDTRQRVPADQLFLRIRGGASDLSGEINRRGSNYTRWLQATLNELDGAGLTVDGRYGARTRAAVRAYQRNRPPLAVDGSAGSQTERRLIADGAPYPPGFTAAMDTAPGAPPAFPPVEASLVNIHPAAQYALRRLSRGDAASRSAAVNLVNAARSLSLIGIFSDLSPEAAPAVAPLGLTPGRLIPPDRIGRLIRLPAGGALILFRERVKRIAELMDGLLRQLAQNIQPQQEPYGGFDLRREDRDAEGDSRPRWGGQPRPVPQIQPAPRHVRQLQQDLDELGFGLGGAANGRFGRRTEWGVREFQIYAKMRFAAQENTQSNAARYVDRLAQVATGAHRYTGPVSGVVNRDTRVALQHWRANNWRCPVVIEAWSIRNGRRHALIAENLWRHDDMQSTAARVYARDFSGYYTFPPTQNPNALTVIGDFARYPPSGHNGPRSVPPDHTWPEAEIMPNALTGVALNAMTAAQRSTYKVVRAVSEVECYGFFDSVNAYDNAFVSLGPCHWTLGVIARNRRVDEGELCGYLAYLRHADPAAFRDAIEFFGARADENWVRNRTPNGAALFDRRQRKYKGWMALQTENPNRFRRVPLNEAEGNYFKTWHWHYRFVMAGRAVNGFRRGMWDMARVRIRDLRDIPWGAGVAAVNAGRANARPATIGDVFTSERAMAIILRWHIRYPRNVVNGASPAARLRRALRHARANAPNLNWNGAPNAWTDAHERALVDGLRQGVRARANRNLIQTVNYINNWPNWAGGRNRRGYRLAANIGRLSRSRGSFRFHHVGLPPAP